MASSASYLANGTVFVVGALTFNQVLALIGAGLAVATFVVNFYYQRRRDKRENEFHEKRMHARDATRAVKPTLPDSPDSAD